MLLLLCVVSMLITFVCAFIAWQRRRVPGAFSFLVVLLGALEWAFFYMLELLAGDLAGKILWDDMQFIGMFVVSAAWLDFTLVYAGRSARAIRSLRPVLIALTLIFMAIVFTDRWHGLVRVNAGIVKGMPLDVLLYDYGPAMWAMSVFCYIMMFAGMYLLVAHWHRAEGLNRRQTGIIIAGFSVPLLVTIIGTSGVLIFGQRDVSPFTMALCTSIVAWGLFRYRIFDILPVARSVVVENMSDAVVVFDERGRVVDLNPAAASIFGPGLIGQLPSSSIGMNSMIPEFHNAPDDMPMVLEMFTGEGDARHYYNLHVKSMSDAGGIHIGSVAVFSDITEIKRANEELEVRVARRTVDLLKLNRELSAALGMVRESEARFRSIIENMQDVYYRADMDGIVTFVSPSAPALLGYDSVDQVLGLNIARDIYADPGERNAFLEAIGKTGSVTGFEVRLRKRDGSRIIVSTSSHFTFDPAGNRTGVEGIFRDITDLKKSERELRESESLYRTIFENTGSATIIIRADTTIILANDGFAKLSGYPKEELEGKRSWTGFVVKEDLVRMKKYHDDRREDADLAPRVYEFRFIDRGGQTRDCINIVAMIPGTTNSVASVMDISARTKVEQELRESEARFRAIIENMQDVYYRADLTGALQYASPSFVKTLGYDTMDDIMGMSIGADFYAVPEERKVFLEKLGRDGSVYGYIVTLRKRDGTPIIVSTNSQFVLDARGKRIGVEGVFRDITDQKMAEDRIRESLQEKEVLLREIHHRVKNNMQIISSLLTLQMHSINDPRLMDVFQDSQARIRTMAIIHEQLYRSTDLSGINIADYVHNLLGFLTQSYAKGHIALKTDIEPVLLDLDRAIPCGLIINELVSNCIKHAFSGQDAPALDVSLKADRELNAMIMRVADNGTGLPAGFAIHTLKSLGLTLVNALVKQLSGTIRHENRNGAVFEVVFPLS